MENNGRHEFQLRLLIVLNELRLRGKWSELAFGMKYLNRIITRNYVDPYWKFVYLMVYRKLPRSMETVPRFIE